MSGDPMGDLPLFAAAEHRPLPPSVLADLGRALDYFRAHALPFSAESIRDRLSPSSRMVLEDRAYEKALGGWFQGLSRGRTPQIRAKGWVDSARDSARGRPLRLWECAA